MHKIVSLAAAGALVAATASLGGCATDNATVNKIEAGIVANLPTVCTALSAVLPIVAGALSANGQNSAGVGVSQAGTIAASVCGGISSVTGNMSARYRAVARFRGTSDQGLVLAKDALVVAQLAQTEPGSRVYNAAVAKMQADATAAGVKL